MQINPVSSTQHRQSFGIKPVGVAATILGEALKKPCSDASVAATNLANACMKRIEEIAPERYLLAKKDASDEVTWYIHNKPIFERMPYPDDIGFTHSFDDGETILSKVAMFVKSNEAFRTL